MRIKSVSMNIIVSVRYGLSRFTDDEICAGPYRMIFDGKEVDFDFDEYDVGVNREESVLDIDCWAAGADYEEFQMLDIEDFMKLDKVEAAFLTEIDPDSNRKLKDELEGVELINVIFCIEAEDEDGVTRIVRLTYYDDDKYGLMEDCEFFPE